MEVPYAIKDAALKPAGKGSKKRKKRAASGGDDGGAAVAKGGWKKIDMQEIELEGFEDGCAFELEELTGKRRWWQLRFCNWWLAHFKAAGCRLHAGGDGGRRQDDQVYSIDVSAVMYRPH